MSHSYNGWPFIPASQVVRALVPGTADVRNEIRRGEVATILNAWTALWHRDVRRVDTYKPRDYWGWSATNSHPTSCHLSGTAVDLNATTLPFRRLTMPASQRATVDRMVRDFRGVVAWGGHWTNPIDEMHAEIAVRPGDPRIAALVRDLSNGYLGVWPGTVTPDPEPPQEDDDMTPDQERLLADVWDQLRGPGGNGWPQLGHNEAGDALTLVDAVAHLRGDLDRLTAALERLTEDGA